MEGASSWSARSHSISRSFVRVANKIVYYARHHTSRFLILALLACTALILCLWFTLDPESLLPEAVSAPVQSFAQFRNLRRINSFMTEYPRGPREIPHPETRDANHLHGIVGRDLKTGKPLWEPQPLTFRMTPEQKTEAHRGYCFNTRVSKSIALDRPVPDYNENDCATFDYSRFDLPKSDVVIVFHNEDLSVLLRSIVSILDRTPPHLLNEIILFNDDSNSTSHPWLFNELPTFVKNTPKTRLIHTTQRQGLMMARVHASKVSQLEGAPILVYLDSHIECANKWLEPLVLEIWQDYRTIVTPMIHTIGADDLNFEKNALGVLSFSWSLGQTHPPKTRDADDFIGPIAPKISPVMAGGLFAASRKWFIDELEGYDPEMKLYGGEEMEIGFKTWMCGGRLLNIPCSHIGHIFRTDKFWKGQVYKVPMEEIVRNKRRVAEVWLDDYLEIFDEVAGKGTLPVGDLTRPKWIKEQKLKCKSFKWFLENIAKDIWVPNLKNARKGAIFSAPNNLCLDNLQASVWEYAGIYGCHFQKGSQSFLLDQGQLRIGGSGYRFCIVPDDKKKLQISTCEQSADASKKWSYEVQADKPQVRARDSSNSLPVGLMRFGSDQCMALSRGQELMRKCDPNDSEQLLAWTS